MPWDFIIFQGRPNNLHENIINKGCMLLYTVMARRACIWQVYKSENGIIQTKFVLSIRRQAMIRGKCKTDRIEKKKKPERHKLHYQYLN